MTMPTLGSIFTGIGGIDKAFEEAGVMCRWQIENNLFARRALERHWPEVKRYEDATKIRFEKLERVHILAGGDPCPIRSRAKGGRPTMHPDLAPYFLEAVRAVRPVWVLRENVPAADVHQFALCLEWLEYSTSVIEVDSAEVTGQSRPREIVIGVLASTGSCPLEIFSILKSGSRNRQTLATRGHTVAHCVTTRYKQYSLFDNFVAESSRGLRVLTPVERARLQGFPDDWLEGFSDQQQCRLYGNAVTVSVFRQIARHIIDWFTNWGNAP